MKNAIILAAGKSSKFAPFTYEKPKGLFCVKGEILIERQIEQLQKLLENQQILLLNEQKEKQVLLERTSLERKSLWKKFKFFKIFCL